MEIKQALAYTAEKHKHDINFVFVSPAERDTRARMLNVDLFTQLGPEDWPAIVIQQPQTRHKYPCASPGGINLTDLAPFVDKYLSGHANQSIRSEPIPAHNGPVTAVVADNFDAVVFDPHKDVIVDFYDPNCRPCQRLAPIWDALGTVFIDEHSIVVAKVNEPANDVSEEILFYPTIRMFRAGRKQPTIDFSDEPTLERLVKFITENASNKATKVDEEHVLSWSSDLDRDRIASMSSSAEAATSEEADLEHLHDEL